jgi:hypothetical protein
MRNHLNSGSDEDLRVRIKKLADELGEIFVERAAKFKRASLFAKIGLISIGSAVAAIAQFAQFPPKGPSAWQIAGIGASVIVAVGGIFVWLTEDDAPRELSTARKAVEKAREALVGYEEMYQIAAENDRLVFLIQAIYLMRSVIEQAASAAISETKMAQLILEACDRSLPIAMGFQQADQWTLGIYQAEPLDDGRRELVCVSTKRAIECDPANARRWKEGTGIAGVSFSIRDEVIIPDLQAEGIGSVFGSAANEVRDYDIERYRSMVAVPILVGKHDEPWGVVAATNDQVAHFSISQRDGLSNSEGARALASMVALGISVCRGGLNNSPPQGFPTVKSGDTGD